MSGTTIEFGWEDLGPLAEDQLTLFEGHTISPLRAASLVSIWVNGSLWTGTFAAAFRRNLLSIGDIDFLLQMDRGPLDLGLLEVPPGGVAGRLMEEVRRAVLLRVGYTVGGDHYDLTFDWRREDEVVTIDRRKDGAKWLHPGGFSDNFDGLEPLPFSAREELRDIIDQFSGPEEDPPDLCQWRARRAWEEICSGRTKGWGEQLSLDLIQGEV